MKVPARCRRETAFIGIRLQPNTYIALDPEELDEKHVACRPICGMQPIYTLCERSSLIAVVFDFEITGSR